MTALIIITLVVVAGRIVFTDQGRRVARHRQTRLQIEVQRRVAEAQVHRITYAAMLSMLAAARERQP